MEFVIYFALVLVGLCMGSFAGAQTWRLRARQLKQDKKNGEEVDAKEYKQLVPLTKGKLKDDHSRCLHCGYQLQWYDLIPLVSWLTLKGKCRNCHKPIGVFEPLIELGMVAFFVLSYAFWPFSLDTWQAVTHFVLWLVAGVILGILFAYDAKWFLLPDVMNWSLVGVGAVISILTIVTSPHPLAQLLSVVSSVAFLGGVYLLLYMASRARWVGFGDVKLGLGLGLLLANWELAVLALFAANLFGSVAVLPGLISGKLKSRSHVPFGPFLILGAFVGQLFGGGLIDYYLTHVLYIGL